MAYQKSAQDQLRIIRQSCLNRAVDLYIANKIDAGKLEITAEYFVKTIYVKLGLPIGSVFTEAQTQGAIVLQSSLARAVELCVAGKIETKDIADNMCLFGEFIYKGINSE